LKELERLAPKMKGIVQQSVKDALQSLMDEGLVRSDKVGSSNFFWSFPSQRGVEAKTRLEKIERETSELQQRLSETKGEIADERKQRPLSDDRGFAEQRLAVMTCDVAALQKEITAHGASDPAVVEAKRRAVLLAHEAALRWTDNYSALLGYLRGLDPGLNTRDIQQMLQIQEDYEDIC